MHIDDTSLQVRYIDSELDGAEICDVARRGDWRRQWSDRRLADFRT
jgi:hypothetical protein